MRCLVLLLGLLGTAALAQVPNKLIGDVQRAEQLGLALFQAYQASPATDQFEKARAAAESARLQRCDVPYKAVVVTPKLVYLLAGGEGIVVGRHFRIEVAGDGQSVASVEPSTLSCLRVEEWPASASAGGTRPARASFSHSLTPAPNEFHVFLSLKHDMPIYVATGAGVWKVESGLILYQPSR